MSPGGAGPIKTWILYCPNTSFTSHDLVNKTTQGAPTKSDINIESASNQATRLEEIVIVFRPCLFRLLRWQVVAGFREASVLVDDGELFYDVVVESIEHYEQDTAARRKGKQATFSEAVWLKFAILERADLILVCDG